MTRGFNPENIIQVTKNIYQRKLFLSFSCLTYILCIYLFPCHDNHFKRINNYFSVNNLFIKPKKMFTTPFRIKIEDILIVVNLKLD